MSCELHRSRLSDFLDGVLPPEIRAELEHHLAACAACARELSALRATVDALGKLPPVAPPAKLRKRVLDAFIAQRRGGSVEGEAGVARQLDAAALSSAWLSSVRGWALSAAAIVVSLLLTLASHPGGELSRPGAPKLCLPVIAAAGLLPAIALLVRRLRWRRRGPASHFALSAAAGALAGQLVLFAFCPMLDARAHALVLHSGVLAAVTLLGTLLGLAQRLRPIGSS